jgi:co-chaperonin GroES (HSP10)
MKIRPLSDRILVKRVAEQRKTARDLHIDGVDPLILCEAGVLAVLE